MADRTGTVYRIEGLTCASCAAKFEKYVAALPLVEGAQVNFGACKLTVYGQASVYELEQAGAFDGLRIVEDKGMAVPSPTKLWRRRSTWTTLASALLLLAGWLLEGEGGFGLMSVSAYAASIAAGGFVLFRKGLRSLLRLDLTMNALMTIAVIGAVAIGEWSEGATVVALFALSEALEAYSMERARSSLRSLMRLAPKEAVVRRGQEEVAVAAHEVRVGETLIVKPGQCIALDGRVAGGSSAVSQSSITGESLPVAKRPGDDVYAGTWNGGGFLEIEVTKRAEDSTLAKIIHLVEEAQADKAPAQTFIERFAKVYTPVIVLAALLLAVAPPLFAGDWSGWLYRALALLVVGCPCALVISTPIAVVTAIGNAARNGVLIKGGIHLEQLGRLQAAAFDKTGTLTEGRPVVAEVVALAGADERRVLRIAAALERRSDHPLAAAVIRRAKEAEAEAAWARDGLAKDAAAASAGAADAGAVCACDAEAEAANVKAASAGAAYSADAEAASACDAEAAAVSADDADDADDADAKDAETACAGDADAAEQAASSVGNGLAAASVGAALAAEPDVSEFVSVAGQGVHGLVDGVRYRLGAPDYVTAHLPPLSEGAERELRRLRGQGGTVIALADDRRLLALVAAADTVRPAARDAVRELRRLGLSRLIMLTGDHRQAAEPVARQLGLDGVQAGLLPEQKLRAVRQLGERGAVAMIGDGVNDAPALASATVGVAMGGAGADAALETADVVMMNDDLAKLPYAIRLSRKARAVIRHNVAAALGLKLLAIVLIVPDWLTLWMAIAADMGATLLVTLNSLRLIRLQPKS